MTAHFHHQENAYKHQQHNRATPMLRKLVDRGLMSPPLYALSAISSIIKIFHAFINVNNTKAKDLYTEGEQQIQKFIENYSHNSQISKMPVQVITMRKYCFLSYLILLHLVHHQLMKQWVHLKVTNYDK